MAEANAISSMMLMARNNCGMHGREATGEVDEAGGACHPAQACPTSCRVSPRRLRRPEGNAAVVMPTASAERFSAKVLSTSLVAGTSSASARGGASSGGLTRT